MIVPAFGITGGMSSGVTNLGRVTGSSVPPGIAANTRVSLPPILVVKYNPPIAAALNLRNPLLETIFILLDGLYL
jgi:hypothetical protein